MTNAELITKIKAEIERREGYISVTHFAEDLISFLSTLESEKPMNPEEELNGEIKKFVAEYDYERSEDILLIAIVARHFAKWQAEQLLKSSPLPEDTVLFNKGVEEGKRLAEEEQADLFTIVALDSTQRAKEQMMKGAVEGVVCYGSKGAYIETDFLGEYDTDVYGNPGDKVRVIVLPKED